MINRFTGKVALITGSASGIGEAVALQLAKGGARVVVADIDTEGTARIVHAIETGGGQAAPFEVNVADPMEVEALVAFAERTCGGLHLAVNNAGIGGPSAAVADYLLPAVGRGVLHHPGSYHLVDGAYVAQ